jgi:predicted dehydrogenase
VEVTGFGDLVDRPYEKVRDLFPRASINESRLPREYFDSLTKVIGTQKDITEFIRSGDSGNAVYVSTPDFAHHAYLEAAIEGGKHVFCEKPLDITYLGALEVVRGAKEKGVVLQVDFHKRPDPYHNQLPEIIQRGKGELGEVLSGYAWMKDQIVVPKVWFKGWAHKASPFSFLGSHMVDLVAFAMGFPRPARVTAVGHKKKLRSLGIDSYDDMLALVEFDNGANVIFDTNWVMNEAFPSVVSQGFELWGTDGHVRIDSTRRGEELTTNQGFRYVNKGFIAGTTDEDGNYYETGYRAIPFVSFARNTSSVLSGRKTVAEAGQSISGEEALVSTAVLRAATISTELDGMPLGIARLEEIDRRIRAEFSREGENGLKAFYEGQLYCTGIGGKEELRQIVESAS